MGIGTRFTRSSKGELLDNRKGWFRGPKLTSLQQQYDEDESSEEGSRGPSRARKGKGRASTCRSTTAYSSRLSPADPSCYTLRLLQQHVPEARFPFLRGG